PRALGGRLDVGDELVDDETVLNPQAKVIADETNPDDLALLVGGAPDGSYGRSILHLRWMIPRAVDQLLRLLHRGTLDRTHCHSWEIGQTVWRRSPPSSFFLPFHFFSRLLS